MLKPRSLVAAFVTLLAACASSEGGSALESSAPSADAGAARDASSTPDAGATASDAGATASDAGATASDASASDAGRADGGVAPVDAGVTPVDAGRSDAGATPGDAGAACHALAFGQPEVIFIVVPSAQMGALAGGAIVDGIYDLVAVETSTASQASWGLRSTWRFAGNTIEQIDQLRTASLGAVTVRTGAISVSGATISRTYTCGSSDATVASLNYDSKVVSGKQTIRVMSGGLRFTFEKR
jgi:hypothetical protein